MASAVLSLLGLFVAGYLYLYKTGAIGTLACGTGECETVQLSRWSVFLGVDVALIGIGGYAALLAVSLAGLRLEQQDRSGPALLLLVLSGIGVAFTLYLTAMEVFVIEAICRWCVASAAIITGVLLASVLDWRRTVRPPAAGAGVVVTR